MCERGYFIYSDSPCYQKHSIKFLCKRIYGFEEDFGWRIPRWRFLLHGHLWWVNGIIFAVLESPWYLKPSIKFLLKRIHGWEDVGWRIPRWLISAWPSLMCEWGAFSCSESLYCRKPFIKFFSQNKIMVWKRCLKNNKIAVKCMAIFDFWMEWF